MISFQLTRSAGSVTQRFKIHRGVIVISTHTLRGERDLDDYDGFLDYSISTHTLRGERDSHIIPEIGGIRLFQLTRSVGSVTNHLNNFFTVVIISTHTLRGERDTNIPTVW